MGTPVCFSHFDFPLNAATLGGFQGEFTVEYHPIVTETENLAGVPLHLCTLGRFSAP
jgi:hypothetical protein